MRRAQRNQSFQGMQKASRGGGNHGNGSAASGDGTAGGTAGGATTYSDPTYNVLQLVNAAVERLNDVQESEFNRIDEVHKLHIHYMEKLAMAEAKRLDSIRGVDVQNIAIASTRADAQANVLASQLNASAETLRQLVQTTAANLATSVGENNKAIMDRIAILEKAQYEAYGAGVPTRFIGRLDDLEKSVTSSAGRDTGKGESISKFIGWILFAMTVLGFIFNYVAKK